MKVTMAPLVSPFDWPLKSAIRITAQARPYNWSSVWELPPAPLPALPRGRGEEGEQSAASSSSVPLELVPYGSAKVYKVSMFPFFTQAADESESDGDAIY
jgi:hypothetical protein